MTHSPRPLRRRDCAGASLLCAWQGSCQPDGGLRCVAIDPCIETIPTCHSCMDFPSAIKMTDNPEISLRERICGYFS